jgi:hypothetical protein
MRHLLSCSLCGGFLYLLLISFHQCLARVGIDLSIAVPSSAAWSAYFAASELSTSFGIVHAVLYDGSINPNLITTLRSAWTAGTQELSVYAYPCISSSPYAINNAKSCGSPEAQLDALVQYLQGFNITFRYHHATDTNATALDSNSTHPFNLNYTPFFDRTIPEYDTSKIGNITLQTLFLNVEDTMPNYYFSYLHYDNVEFLWRYTRHAQEVYGIEIGFYTSLYTWMDVMTDIHLGSRVYFYSGNATDYVTFNPFAQYKLWVPRYDQDNSMSFFRPFGDWQQVYIKQTTGGSNEARRLTDSRVCTDFSEDMFLNSTIVSAV